MATSDELYERLIVSDCRAQLPDLLFTQAVFSENEMLHLVMHGSILAMRADGTREGAIAARRAYDIATRLPRFTNGTRGAILEAADCILTQLGNFPGRTLLRSSNEMGVSSEASPTSSGFLALQKLARESDNRSSLTSQLLTDFQIDLLDKLRDYQSVSFSAPTSAGKSTALELEIVRSLRSGGGKIVIVVPTRALIRQVTYDLIALLNEADLGEVPVLSAPDPEQVTSSPSVVCVFTQERLQTLLANPDWVGNIDVLIVDEAQEIGEGARGQTLELVILQVLSGSPECRICFSSPLRSNPEFLLSTVGRTLNTAAIVDHSAPVTQNIFLVNPVRNKPREATYSAWLGGATWELGHAQLPFAFRGTKSLANFAALLTKPEETSIIYASGAAKAEDLADSIAEGLPEVGSESIDDLVQFVHDHIHRDYHLGSVASRGVGFHYGKLPQIVRAKVEDLLKEKALRFVCCTSTLLQGVNLPAKNIFVENPKRGKGQPMGAGDFWNLVGRAGRLAKEFQGNIFCLRKDEWENDPLSSTRFFPLNSAFEEATARHSTTLLNVLTNPPQSAESDFQWAEQALARIFVEFTEQGARVADSRYATPSNSRVLAQIDEACEGISKIKTLPANLYRKNPYFLPMRLDELAKFFRSQGSIEEWIPANPYVARSYYRYEPILNVIERIFIRADYDRHKYFTVLALQWMTGDSLKQLITGRLEFRNISRDNKREINNNIRGLFEDIEDTVRYTYVKYFKVYGEVLRAVLEERGQQKLFARIPSIHLFLEYGAANQTLINLMSFGLSRTSAILLKSHLSLPDDLDSAACRQRIDRVSRTSTDLPALCRAEIMRLRRQR